MIHENYESFISFEILEGYERDELFDPIQHWDFCLANDKPI